MQRLLSFTALLLFTAISVHAQYEPQVPLQGNTAIAQNDSRFVDWAAACTLQRGWMDIADTSLGHPTLGTESDAVGIPTNGVVSLGDSGIAVLTFDYAIYNGSGPDFAVFENGFSNPENDTFAYLELAFVEVSSDGVHYFRFPALSAMQDTLQIDNFTYCDASKYHNLAGKYVGGYGTPFDLEELKDVPGLDIAHVSHVRIVDVIGSIDPLYASRDKDGRKINDPYPSPYPSAGFDLNGVGVINSLKPAAPTGVKETDAALSVKIYPNPAKDVVYIISQLPEEVHYSLRDVTGKQLSEGSFSRQAALSLKDRPKGFYFLYMEQGKGHFVQKIVKY